MKRVSFKVAKAIKEAGYPQVVIEGTLYFDEKGSICTYESDIYEYCEEIYCICPSCLEVWLWLWREKHIAVEADYSCANDDWFDGGICGKKFNDPEEVIISSIEYLVDNNLIK